MRPAFVLAVVAAIAGGMPAPAAEQAGRCARLEMYSRPGCPHCSHAREFLASIGAERPDLEIRILDVQDDPAARERLRSLFTQHAVSVGGVPAFDVCGELIVGFAGADTTGKQLLALLGEADPAPPQGVRVPGLGLLDVERLGLPLFTIALGLIDGFNPCAMWVLLILLSVLVNLRERRTLLVVAGTFVVVSGLAYFAFMAAWLNVFLLIGWSRAIQVLLGCVAVAVGAVHLKDLVAWRHGPSLSIPQAAKPGIYRRIRAIVGARSLPAALAGAAALATVVNFVELLCTAGLPALYTQILSLHSLSTGTYYGYLALYNLAYLLDDAVMVTIVVVTLDRLKLQERAGRWLKGLSGAVMLTLGCVLLLRPSWLAA